MIEFKPNIQRLLATVRLEEPDCVPLADFQVDEPIMDQFMGRPIRTVEDHVAFQAAAGYDFLYLRANYDFHGTSPVVSTGSPRSWEYARKNLSESEDLSHDHPLKSMADWDAYPWPDPQTVDIAHFARASAVLPEGFGLITGVGGVFTRTWMIMGYEDFCMALIDNPEFVGRVAAQVGKTQVEVLRRLVALPDVYAIWYGDDLAYTESLMASPEVLRKLFFPWIEELSSIAHGAGMPFIMHSDGVLWDVLDDLVTLGLNAIHPIEPKAMDIYELKRKYGRKLALFGNIDIGYALTKGTGTPQAIRKEVRQKIKALAPGGGYGVASGGGGVTRYTSLENFLAMREATLEFGRYPIKL